MKELYKRIAVLQKKAEQAIEARARNEPFSVIRVKSIIADKAQIVFWPSGLYGDKEVSAPMTILEAIKTAKGAKRFVDLAFCPEWWHAYAMASPLKAAFKARDLREHPEIAAIYGESNPEEYIKFLSEIPQSFKLRKD